MVKVTARVLLGGLGSLLFFLGRGARFEAAQLNSMPAYVVSVVAHLLGAGLLLMVFVVWARSRLAGPRTRVARHKLTVIGWFHLAMAGIMIAGLVSLFGMASNVGSPISDIPTRALSHPDALVKLSIGLLCVGVGATALSGATVSWLLIRITAVPLAYVWPHGFILAAWSAWSSIGATNATPPKAAERDDVARTVE
jgi:hypothetical protein